jgi:hypothetical protein
VATETYKFGGSSTPGTASSRLILEGSVRDPKRYVDKGGTVELDEEHATALRKKGYKLTKSDDEVSETATDGSPQPTAPQTEEDQLRAQSAPTGSTTKTGSKPAGK